MESVENATTAVARLALIVGVLVSFVLLIGGLVLGTGGLAGATGLKADVFLSAGILVLLGTPVLRVVVLAVGYVREKQTTFALVAFCILLLLGASVAIGLRGE